MLAEGAAGVVVEDVVAEGAVGVVVLLDVVAEEAAGVAVEDVVAEDAVGEALAVAARGGFAAVGIIGNPFPSILLRVNCKIISTDNENHCHDHGQLQTHS